MSDIIEQVRETGEGGREKEKVRESANYFISRIAGPET